MGEQTVAALEPHAASWCERPNELA